MSKIFFYLKVLHISLIITKYFWKTPQFDKIHVTNKFKNINNIITIIINDKNNINNNYNINNNTRIEYMWLFKNKDRSTNLKIFKKIKLKTN